MKIRWYISNDLLLRVPETASLSTVPPDAPFLLSGEKYTVIGSTCDFSRVIIRREDGVISTEDPGIQVKLIEPEVKYRPYTEEELLEIVGCRVYRKSASGGIDCAIVVGVQDGAAMTAIDDYYPEALLEQFYHDRHLKIPCGIIV